MWLLPEIGDLFPCWTFILLCVVAVAVGVVDFALMDCQRIVFDSFFSTLLVLCCTEHALKLLPISFPCLV